MSDDPYAGYPRRYRELCSGQSVAPADRCAATKTIGGVMAFIAVQGSGHSGSIRCRLRDGHEGRHEADYQPFPGFANEFVVWEDSAP